MAVEETPKGTIHPWIVNICNWFWKQRSLVWGTIILGTLLGIFTGWLFADPSTFSKTPVYWAYQHPFYVIMALVILVLLFALSYFVGQSSVKKPESYSSLENERTDPNRSTQ